MFNTISKRGEMITAYIVSSNNSRHLLTCQQPLSHNVTVIPVLVRYLAEGGANVVLQLIPISSGIIHGLASELQRPLVRLRKHTSSGTNTEEQYSVYEALFANLFDAENLVRQRLVNVHVSLLSAVNAELAGLDRGQDKISARGQTRLGDRVAEDESCAMLIDDMSSHGSQFAISFKPKWLAQSPNAPMNAVRCRTCALRACRSRRKTSGETEAPVAAFCPLALTSSMLEPDLALAILAANGASHVSSIADNLARLLTTKAAPLLRKLKHYQSLYDAQGILGVVEALTSDEESSKQELVERLCRAMTLRDCTLYIRSESSDFKPATTELRIADLDPKEGSREKLEKWAMIETQLIADGWYTNDEADRGTESICLLSRSGV